MNAAVICHIGLTSPSRCWAGGVCVLAPMPRSGRSKSLCVLCFQLFCSSLLLFVFHACLAVQLYILFFALILFSAPMSAPLMIVLCTFEWVPTMCFYMTNIHPVIKMAHIVRRVVFDRVHLIQPPFECISSNPRLKTNSFSHGLAQACRRLAARGLNRTGQ